MRACQTPIAQRANSSTNFSTERNM
jgi:hypothetical protein